MSLIKYQNKHISSHKFYKYVNIANTTTNNIEIIPNDVIHIIISNMSSIKQFVMLCFVSKKFRKLCIENNTWINLLKAKMNIVIVHSNLFGLGELLKDCSSNFDSWLLFINQFCLMNKEISHQISECILNETKRIVFKDGISLYYIKTYTRAMFRENFEPMINSHIKNLIKYKLINPSTKGQKYLPTKTLEDIYFIIYGKHYDYNTDDYNTDSSSIDTSSE